MKGKSSEQLLYGSGNVCADSVLNIGCSTIVSVCMGESIIKFSIHTGVCKSVTRAKYSTREETSLLGKCDIWFNYTIIIIYLDLCSDMTRYCS